MTTAAPLADQLKDVLHEELRAQRAALLAKLDGLSEREIRMPRTATGTNLLGLVSTPRPASWATSG